MVRGSSACCDSTEMKEIFEFFGRKITMASVKTKKTKRTEQSNWTNDSSLCFYTATGKKEKEIGQFINHYS